MTYIVDVSLFGVCCRSFCYCNDVRGMVAAPLIVMMSATSLRCSNPCRRQIKMVAALLIYGNEEGSKIRTQIIS